MKSAIKKPVLETAEERIAAKKAANLVFFWQRYAWQERLLEMMHRKNTVGAIASNKIGKSASGACIVVSWALGYEPWNYVSDNDPEGVCIEGYWYRKSSLGIKPPVNIIITGEDWKLHLGRVIVPELKKWAPQGLYSTKKNEQGIDFYWEWFNGSTFTLMSYTQDDDLFESFRAQGAWEDEPPPRSKHTALSRGLMLDNGKTLMTLTPLKEAWVLDDIVLSGRKDIGIIDGLKITDNPDLLKSDIEVLDNFGLNDSQKEKFWDLLLYEDKEKGKPVIDKGRGAERYLEGIVPVQKHDEFAKLKILKFIKDIDPSDVAPRVFGQFKSLVGRVIKEFDEDIHKIKPFDVPTNWPVVVMIDFHLSTPQAISYWTVNRQDINYLIAETWKNLSADEIADDIVRKMRGFGWKIENVYIDPLSKGDTAYMRNALGANIRDTFSILEERLSEVGVTLHVASKDKESGVKNIQTWFKGPNGSPTCYLFEDCERHFYEFSRWVFDDKGKPSKDCCDHFMENFYRFTLTGTRFEDYDIKPLPREYATGAGNWMGV